VKIPVEAAVLLYAKLAKVPAGIESGKLLHVMAAFALFAVQEALELLNPVALDPVRTVRMAPDTVE
jgi:hypothetical protein